MALTWDGKANGGAVVPDGEYTITMAARDSVGNSGPGKTRTVRVVTLLGSVAGSARLIYPQRRRPVRPSSTLSFGSAARRRVTWTIRDAANNVVFTHLDGVSMPAGSQSWAFNGRKPDGTMLPVGMYTSFVSATDGTFSWASRPRSSSTPSR